MPEAFARIDSLKSSTLSENERKTVTNQSLADITSISNVVQGALSRLPLYEQRVYVDVKQTSFSLYAITNLTTCKIIKSLHEKLDEAKSNMGLRRKFAFKGRAKKPDLDAGHVDQPMASVPLTLVEQESQGNPLPPSQLSNSSADSINITSSRGELIAVPRLQQPTRNMRQPSASIRDVQDCTVDLHKRSSYTEPLANLQIFGARRSLIVCGHVNGSVFLSESHNSVLVVICGQMRLTRCQDCVIYLHCTSKPVIELSEGIKFAPCPDQFVSKHPH